MGKAKHFIQAKTLEKIHTLTRMKTKKKLQKIQPLTLLYTIFHEKRYPFHIPSISDKWCPFHIPCLELCIPVDCCKSIDYFRIPHNTLCLPPKFCITYCLKMLLGKCNTPRSI